MTADGVRGGTLSGSTLERDLRRHARLALQERKSRLVHFEECEVFVEWIGPPQQLVVFGAGHDAIPLVAMAKELGWEVTVADGRPAYARHHRFPGADRMVLLPRDASIAGIAMGTDTAVVMMTHNYPQDERLLPQILARKPRYLGLLGPRIRTERLLESIDVPATDVDLHAPVGLDIGGDTPEAIALSILAEAQAVLAGRNGGMLKYRRGSIHTAPAEAIEASGSRMPALFPAEISVCENAALVNV